MMYMKQRHKKRAGLLVISLLFLCLLSEAFVWQMQMKKVKETWQESMEEKMEDENRMQSEVKKIAYITFDDGPSQYTARILDVLKMYHAPATFFLIGTNICEERKPVLMRMEKEGHAIGIHTYSHNAKEIYASNESFQEDFMRAEEMLNRYFPNHKMNLYRFPWGSENAYLKPIEKGVFTWLREKKITYVDWNVSGEDSVGNPSGSQIFENVKKDVTRFQEPVILLHDSSINKNTVSILPCILAYLQENGYQFQTITTMKNPYQFPKD